jgi:hypothetical protein
VDEARLSLCRYAPTASWGGEEAAQTTGRVTEGGEKWWTQGRTGWGWRGGRITDCGDCEMEDSFLAKAGAGWNMGWRGLGSNGDDDEEEMAAHGKT